MRRLKKIKDDKNNVDLTPMIDVCFLLIAFFIMVVEVAKSEIVEIFLPIATHAQDDVQDDRIIINIDYLGQVYIRSQEFGKPNNLTNKRIIENKIQSAAKEAGFDNNSMSHLAVVLRVDAHAEYKYVQCILHILTKSKIKIRKIHYGAKSTYS